MQKNGITEKEIILKVALVGESGNNNFKLI